MDTIGSMSEPTIPALLYKSKSAALFIIDIGGNSPQYVHDGMLVMHHFFPEKQGLHISLSGECRCLAQSPDGRLTKEDGKCHPYHQPLQVLSLRIPQTYHSWDIHGQSLQSWHLLQLLFPHRSSEDRGQARLQLVYRYNQ